MPGKVAIVSGASYGIGADIARQLANDNWEVVLVARSKDKLRQVQFEIAQSGGVSLALPADLTNYQEVQNVVKKTIEAFGEINLVVNNAAYVAPIHKFHEGNVEEWQRMVAVNVFGTLHLTRSALPHMLAKGQGHVVFMSSFAGQNPSEGLAVHSGTKHMVEAVANSLRKELAEQPIKISIVRPGGVSTPGYEHAVGGGEAQKAMKELNCWVPDSTENCVRPETVAAAIVHLVKQTGACFTELNIGTK